MIERACSTFCRIRLRLGSSVPCSCLRSRALSSLVCRTLVLVARDASPMPIRAQQTLPVSSLSSAPCIRPETLLFLGPSGAVTYAVGFVPQAPTCRAKIGVRTRFAVRTCRSRSVPLVATGWNKAAGRPLSKNPCWNWPRRDWRGAFPLQLAAKSAGGCSHGSGARDRDRSRCSSWAAG